MLPDLGRLIPDAAALPWRDAVHVAVLAAVAGDLLVPGNDVGVDANGKATAEAHPIGIVDPYLHDVVKPGERFWIFVYPNAVTTLRHSWHHPVIDAPKPEPAPRDPEHDAFHEVVDDDPFCPDCAEDT